MNYFKQNHLSLLIIAFLVVSSFTGGSTNLGATTARTTITNPWTFQQAVTLSSTLTAVAATLSGLVTTDAGELHSYAVATTTMTATENLILADVNAYDTVIVNPNVAGDTALTFFASSTASAWLPTAGDTQRTCFVNGTTTAGTSITFAGGTGTKFLVASSSVSAVGSATIYPQKMGCFVFTRGNATASTFDILMSYTAFK